MKLKILKIFNIIHRYYLVMHLVGMHLVGMHYLGMHLVGMHYLGMHLLDMYSPHIDLGFLDWTEVTQMVCLEH
jgi:hypothetical protein